MEGIYLVNKPYGITSFDVIRQLRHTLKTKSIGHAGTLDPMATGLMIVLVGRATKLSNHLIQQTKTYEGTITFGFSTDTFDKLGKITLQLDHFELEEHTLDEAVKTIKESNSQIPPMFSAIKVDGKKLYQFARANQEVDVQARHIEIMDFERYPINNNAIDFKTTVSKGTYIRSIANDLGNLLHIPAHLSRLNRTQSGMYLLSDAYPLDTITADTLPQITLKGFAESLPKVTVKPYLVPLIKNGIRLDERQTNLSTIFSVYDCDNHLLAIYEPVENAYKPILWLGE